jgi:hypothetical protein
MNAICQEIMVRKNSFGEITVKVESPLHHKALRNDKREHPDPPELLGAWHTAFRQIWPVKQSSLDWHDDWSSIPLEGVSNVYGIDSQLEAQRLKSKLRRKIRKIRKLVDAPKKDRDFQKLSIVVGTLQEKSPT